MELIRTEIKKIIFSPAFLFALVFLITFSGIIFATEISIYKQPEESLYRKMCSLYEGKVDNGYINKMNLEAEEWNEKLLEYEKVDEDYKNGKISAIEYQGLLNQKDSLIKQKQVFDEIYYRAMELYNQNDKKNQLKKASNPAMNAKGAIIERAETPKLFYDTGWIRYFNSTNLELIFLIFLGIILGRIYPLEYEFAVMPLILTTKKGARIVSFTKILCSVIIIILLSSLFLLIKFIIFKSIWGLDNFNESLISVIPSHISSLTLIESVKLGMAAQLFGCVVFGLFSLVLSLIIKNSLGAYILSIAAAVLALFINGLTGSLQLLSFYWILLNQSAVLNIKHLLIVDFAINTTWIYFAVNTILVVTSGIFCIIFFKGTKAD